MQEVTARYSFQFERVALVLPASAIVAFQTRRIRTGENRASERERQFGPDELEQARAWIGE